MRSAKTPRRGLTLIELLVAAALSLVIMAILAGAFATGTDTLRQLKSAGDMQRALRTAAERIKADLAAHHLDDAAVAGGTLANVRFDLNRTSYPTSGVVRIVQRGSAYQEFLHYKTISVDPSRQLPESVTVGVRRGTGPGTAA